jgi:starvation-inducible DNA-binding protein
MTTLAEAAKVAFASEFSFYLKAHNFHWNVEGADFLEHHQLFGMIYEEVYGAIDDFAEKIRSIGSYMPGSYTRFSMLSQIEDETDILSPGAMLHALSEDNEKMIVVLKMAYDLAEQSGEHGFSNFLAERMDAHRKHGWMLRASLK